MALQEKYSMRRCRRTWLITKCKLSLRTYPPSVNVNVVYALKQKLSEEVCMKIEDGMVYKAVLLWILVLAACCDFRALVISPHTKFFGSIQIPVKALRSFCPVICPFGLKAPPVCRRMRSFVYVLHKTQTKFHIRLHTVGAFGRAGAIWAEWPAAFDRDLYV